MLSVWIYQLSAGMRTPVRAKVLTASSGELILTAGSGRSKNRMLPLVSRALRSFTGHMRVHVPTTGSPLPLPTSVRNLIIPHCTLSNGLQPVMDGERAVDF